VTFDSWKSPVADPRATSADVKGYRCYFTNGDDRIQSYEQIECGDDAEAALRAQGLLAVSQFTSAELWQGKRIVGKWSNTGTAGSNPPENADRSA
jgi:hypothetical protein